MAGVIDIRQDVGVDIANARALGSIFSAVGRQEQLRKKKYDLDTIMGQIAAGEPVENAVQIARDNPAPYSKGLGGIMQRVGNFASLGQREDISDSVTEMLLMNKLKESMKYQGLTPEEITQSKRVEAGVEARPGVQRQNFKPVYRDGAITGYVDLTTGEEAPLPEGTIGNAPKTAFKPVYQNGVVTGYVDLTTGQEAQLPQGTAGSAPKTNFKPIYRDGSITGYMDLTSGQEAALPEGTAGNAPQKPILKQGGDGKWYQITPVDGPDIQGEGSAGVGGGLSASPIEGIPAKAPKVDNNAILKISEAIRSMSVTPQNYEAYNEIAKKNGYEIKKTTRPGRVIPAKKGFFGNEVEPERRAADIEEYQLVPLQQGATQEAATPEGFGKRPDGTEKGTGWLGVLPLTIEKDGETFDGEATEYSVDTDAVKVNGKRVLFPTLVPTLTPEEVKVMQNDIIPNKKEVPAQILKKAEAFAKQRIAEGKSPFIQQGEQPASSSVKADKNGAIEISNPDLLDDMRTGLKLIENRQKSPEVIYNAFIKTYTDPNDVAVINSIFNK